MFAKNEKELKTDTDNKNIQSRYRKMQHANNDEWKRQKNERIDLPNYVRIRTLGEKGTYK